MDHVYYNNEKFYVKEGVLNILRKKVRSIDQIEGLENLFNLHYLNLSWNEISEIEGLENLRNFLPKKFNFNYRAKVYRVKFEISESY